MNITITPLRFDTNNGSKLLPIRNEEEVQTTVYWGIYLDDECVSCTSNKELAEKTKQWMEKWLGNKL